ncbi:PhzF family phenazine biosynthesis protein [Pikeienuella piscinae]|uniref:PhzF family phenazine biosynthesis protein n=1 Tax=Pikeienuella piscinae TaxID=2748098 RepID=UPI001FE63338|nr:PhzF family phenazine biosynthesis protein [Pikeienuella piscinae]
MVPFRTRVGLAHQEYDPRARARLLNAHEPIGAYFLNRRDERAFNARLAFPTGGVFEGAAAAALSGWLRDSGRLTGAITIIQAEDMGAPTRLHAVSTAEKGAPVRVSGATRRLD